MADEQDKIDAAVKLAGVVRYHERLVQRAKMFETVSIQTLEEETVTYLYELVRIKAEE